MGKQVTSFLAVALIAAAILGTPRAALATANISVLYTGDTHGHLQSFPFDTDKSVGGVAKRAIFFQDKRRHKKMAWLTLDSGDAISGTALSDVFQGYLDIEAMNRLGYDAMALGVHEFDYGQAVLKQRMAEAKFPILSANVVFTETGEPFAKPYVIVEKAGIKIAIFGLTTMEAARRVAPENFSGLTVLDPAETARALVPQLRGMAEIVVAVTHLGVNEDIHLAGQVAGIDLIAGGMSHSELSVPMKVGQTLVVHDGMYGRNVGLLKLSFNRDADGALKRVWFDSQVETLSSKWVENTDYLTWLGGYKQELSLRMGTIAGSTAGRMGMAKAKSSETELGNFVCDVLRAKCGADVALLPAGFFRAPLPEGPVTLGDLYTAMPFDHYAVILNVTGGELQEILNDAANQIGKSGFPQVSGLSMGIFNGTAYNVQIGGRPVDPFSRYAIATSDQIADGALGFATMGTISDRGYAGYLVRDLVRETLGSGETARSGLFQRIMFLAQEPMVQEAQPESAGSPDSEPVTDTEEPAPAEAAGEQSGFIPDEAGSDSVEPESRLDRSGNPIDEPVKIDDEIITGEDDSGQDMQPASPTRTGTEDEHFATPEMAPDEIAGGTEIGREELNAGTLDYQFFVLKQDDGYEFHLQVTNSGIAPIDLRYASSEMWDFAIFDGENLIWNHNMNMTFMQALKVDILGPGEARDYHCSWAAKTFDDIAVPSGSYRFQASHLLMDTPQRISFQGQI